MSNENEQVRRFAVDTAHLPAQFPTHKHGPEFWEALGRVVGTFGLLEETLGKAIFSLTGTMEYPDDEREAAFEKWIATLQRALSDPLGGLINSYEKAVRAHPKATITNLDDLLAALREAAAYRNVLCHGSWRSPDIYGKSVPLFVDNKMQTWRTPIDVAFLDQVRRNAVELICAVISTVTHMGIQFPGSDGPGVPIVYVKA